MSTIAASHWTPDALSARLRAESSLHTTGGPVSSESAARRLVYLDVVRGVDTGRIAADDAAARFEALAAGLDAPYFARS